MSSNLAGRASNLNDLLELGDDAKHHQSAECPQNTFAPRSNGSRAGPPDPESSSPAVGDHEAAANVDRLAGSIENVDTHSARDTQDFLRASTAGLAHFWSALIPTALPEAAP